jgi:hypothetical protein
VYRATSTSTAEAPGFSTSTQVSNPPAVHPSARYHWRAGAGTAFEQVPQSRSAGPAPLRPAPSARAIGERHNTRTAAVSSARFFAVECFDDVFNRFPGGVRETGYGIGLNLRYLFA